MGLQGGDGVEKRFGLGDRVKRIIYRGKKSLGQVDSAIAPSLVWVG